MDNLIKSISEITEVPCSHLAGSKKVIFNSLDSVFGLKQLAYGKLLPGEKIESHVHPDMEEYFIFVSGEGFYIVENDTYPISENKVLKIPANHFHSLECTGTDSLEFYYFGISGN